MTRQPTPSILDAVLVTDVAKPSTVHLDSIRTDGGTQPREGINAAYVDELVEALQAGATLPPVDVMYDGAAYWLYDGFHRVAAHRQANYLVVPATIHQGTQVEAQWLSYAANQTHGLRRSNDDKQRAIKAALRHPKAQGMANREIARHLGVDHKTVGDWREKLQSSGEIPQIDERTVTRGDTTYTMQTERIGANPAPRPSPLAPAAQPARAYWTPDAARVPGWDDTDEAEYQALLPTWQQPAGQFNSIVELRHITRRRVAERLSLERLDNLRLSLQERRRELWLEERRRERDASAISNQQSPISNSPTPATPKQFAAAVKSATWTGTQPDILPPTNAPLPAWADEPAPPHYTARQPHDERLPAAQRLMALYGAVIDSEDEYGSLTGRFSDSLAVVRDLRTMIGHLNDLINAITHPEEVSAAD